MEIFTDGTIAIDTKFELDKVEQYVNEKGLDTFKLKIGLVDSNERVDLSQDVYIPGYYEKYADLLGKVESIDLSYYREIVMLNFCHNIKELSMANIPDGSYTEYEAVFSYFDKLKKLSVPSASLLKSGVRVNAKDVNVKGFDYAPYFVVDNYNDLISISDFDLGNCYNIENLTLMLVPKLYKVDLSLQNLKTLKLIGNYNLKEIDLPSDLGKLEELSVYSNNDKTDFNENEIVSIIKNKIAGVSNLQKFVFDVKYYPKVVKMLEKELKNAKFRTVFNSFVFCGEFIEGRSVCEYSAFEMEKYDKMMTSIIGLCGVCRGDNDYQAFAKIYLFVCYMLKYGNYAYESGARHKFNNLAVNFANLTNEQTFAKILGNGFCIGNTFGFLNNNFKVVCCGYSRVLAYLLSKVGIKSDLAQVFVGSREEMEIEKKLPVGQKTLNHMILRVKLGDGYVYVDPTGDAERLKGGEFELSALDLNILLKDVLIYVESEYYMKKENGLSSLANKELANAFDNVNRNINCGGVVKDFSTYTTANALTDWCMSEDYCSKNNYLILSTNNIYTNDDFYFKTERGETTKKQPNTTCDRSFDC